LIGVVVTRSLAVSVTSGVRSLPGGADEPGSGTGLQDTVMPGVAAGAGGGEYAGSDTGEAGVPGLHAANDSPSARAAAPVMTRFMILRSLDGLRGAPDQHGTPGLAGLENAVSIHVEDIAWAACDPVGLAVLDLIEAVSERCNRYNVRCCNKSACPPYRRAVHAEFAGRRDIRNVWAF